MKNILLSVLLLQTLMVVTSLADDTNCVVSTTVETNGYRFTVCATNSSPKVGEIITITTTLENVSTNDVTVALTVPLRDHTVQVLWQQKQSMDLTLYGRHSKNDGLSSLKETLEPGKQITESFQINRLFDMSMTGEYEIIMSRWIRIHNETEWGTITAPPIKVTLKGK